MQITPNTPKAFCLVVTLSLVEPPSPLVPFIRILAFLILAKE